jgi:DNA repair exonuclease SbcCD nuclease subunit
MKLGIIGDIHIGAQENNENFLKYQEESLKFAYNKFRENNIEHIVYLGDVFDKRRQVSFKTLKFFQEIFENDSFTHYMLAGNHDCYYKDTNEINSLDLLLNDYDNVKVVSQLPQEIIIQDESFLFTPWINKSNLEESEEIISKNKSKYMFAHLDLAGFEMIKGIKSSHNSLSTDLLIDYERVLTGHYHNYSEKNNITYLGSLCEMTWNDENVDKFIGILDTENNDLEKIQNPSKLYYKLKIKSDEDILDDIDFLKEKNVKIYLYTERNIKIEKYITEIIEIAYDVNIIDEQVLNTIPDIELQKDISIVNLWSNYIDELEMNNTDKNAINKIFESTYIKVISGDIE